MIVSEKERAGIEQDLFSQEFLTTNTNEIETVITDEGRSPFLDEFSFEEPSLKEMSTEEPPLVTPSVEDLSLEALQGYRVCEGYQAYHPLTQPHIRAGQGRS